MNVEFKPTEAAHPAGDTAHFIDDLGNVRGAAVEAHRIAALIDGGMTFDQVLGDFPNLTTAQVDAALRHAHANPGSGRSYPMRTAKSVLRGGGGGGLADAFAAARQDEKQE